VRYHLGSGTRTSHSQRIGVFGLSGAIQISPEDGAGQDLKDGDTVKVQSEYGTVKRAVVLKREIGQGQIFIPLAVSANDAMNLFALHDFSKPDASGFKSCRVKLEKL